MPIKKQKQKKKKRCNYTTKKKSMIFYSKGAYEAYT